MKQRLIDANKLPIKYDGHTVSVWKNDIDNAPTVEAIPKEWIKDYVGSGVSDDIFQRNRKFVLNMIKDWEEENG